MEDSYLFVNFNATIDEESKFIQHDVGIYLRNIDNFKETNIGHARFYVINTFCYSDWTRMKYWADSISGDILDIVESLEDIIENERDFFGLLTVFDRITIDEKYRNLGYGADAMEKIIKYLDIFSIDYIALQPFPIGEEDKAKQVKLIQRLVKFYNNFDFSVIDKESETKLLMGRNLNYVNS